MAQQIQLRRDVAADWTSANPTLALGEIGIETDTGRLKIGDGSTAWTSLTYFAAGNGDLLAINNLADLDDAATARTNLGLGSAATAAATDFDTVGSAAAALAASQPLDADLSAIAAIADVQGDIIVRGASGWERLAKSATATDVLTAGASQPAWAAASAGGEAIPPFVITGTYVLPGYEFTTSNGVQALNGDWTYYTPMRLTVALTLETMSINVATTGAGTTASISVHEMNPNGTAAALTADLGTVSIATTGIKTISGIATSIPAGLYMIRVQTNGTVTLNNILYGGPGANLPGSGNIAVRHFGNTGTTYSGTAPNPGPDATAIVVGTNQGYCHVFPTWSF